MEYEEFIEKIRGLIEKKLGNLYVVEKKSIIKNNDIELEGLVIIREGVQISPNIYIRKYFEEYLNGKGLNLISEDIIYAYYNSNINEELSDIDIVFSFEDVADRVIYRLINFEKNKKLLNNVPYIRILDLALTFHVLMKNSSCGISTIRVTNEYLKFWKVDMQELLNLSNTNTPRIFPPVIKNMNDVIFEILENESKNILEGDDKVFEDMMEVFETGKKNNMYVLSNSNGINGASAILYMNVLRDFAIEKDADLYVLPSSIHEVILIPYTSELIKEDLNNMVEEVNISQVPEEDILSNQSYIYRRHTNSFEF